ncbi:MAG: hypothetical protein Q7S83_00775 [bacterium]|nr:hypothetical protein [bacterium]
MHDGEMYLVSVAHGGRGHGEEMSMLCLADDLEFALNTARTAEKFGYDISRGDDGIFIWKFNVNVIYANRFPIFERRLTYKRVSDTEKSWVEHWNSAAHKALVKNKVVRSRK